MTHDQRVRVGRFTERYLRWLMLYLLLALCACVVVPPPFGGIMAFIGGPLSVLGIVLIYISP